MRALFFLATAAASIVDCNNTSVFRPTTLGLTPDPPVPGAPVHMSVLFNNPGPTINDGTVTTTVTLNFIPFAPSTQPLCENTACPLVTGPNDRSTNSDWPAEGLKGTLTSTIVWDSPEGDNLLCLKIVVKVSGGGRLRSQQNTVIPLLFRDDPRKKQLILRSQFFEISNLSVSTSPNTSDV